MEIQHEEWCVNEAVRKEEKAIVNTDIKGDGFVIKRCNVCKAEKRSILTGSETPIIEGN